MNMQVANSNYFVINRNQLNISKLFVEFYLPTHQALFNELRQGKYPLLSLRQISTRMFDGPFGSNRKIEMYQETGIPYIRVKDVLPGGIDTNGLTYISREKHEELSRSCVVPGNVLVTIAGRIGTAAVFPEFLKEGNITGHIVGIELPEDINPNYLAIFLNSPLGEFQFKILGHRTTRPELNLHEVGQVLVPVPPRLLQDHIAQIMQDVYTARREKIAAADKLLSIIDQYVFERLLIAPESVDETKHSLKPISKLIGKCFDVEFNMGFHKFDPYMEHVLAVKATASFPRETQDPTTEPDIPFNYIDIGSINTQLGEVGEVEEILGSNAPSRARQVVHAGDIIISTVRPTRGATALIPESMDGFICSTGFVIVHPMEKVTSEYLHIALRLSTTLEQFGRRSAGSSYPAILEKDVKETLIPIPDLPIQQEIATEVTRCRTEAKRLQLEAKATVIEAKARVERMILGEENVD